MTFDILKDFCIFFSMFRPGNQSFEFHAFSKFSLTAWTLEACSHFIGLCLNNFIPTWVRNKSCQPDLRFSEQTDVAGGTTTGFWCCRPWLRWFPGCDVIRCWRWPSPTWERPIKTLPRKMTSSLTSDDVLSGKSSESMSTTSEPSWRVVVPPQCQFAPKNVSLVDKIYF